LLRRMLIAYGVLCLIVAGILLAAHVTTVLVIYLAVNGLLIVGGILFERRGYRSRVDRTHGKWQLTGERFVDPTSGREVEVFYNPETGERDYRESGSQG
jgi:membrane protein implicated in regulation of membrane protease activity